MPITRESVIQNLYSTTPAATPDANLQLGEVAINAADEAVFIKNSGGTVKKLSATSDLTTNLVTVATTQTVSGDKTFSGTVALNNGLVFEGATANDFETTLSVVDPTADNAITLPNLSGTVGLVPGSTTQVVYNNAGALGASASFTYDSAANTLQVDGGYIQGSLLGAVQVMVRNTTGSPISAGTPVYAVGYTGGRVLIAPADASDSAKMPAIGMVHETIGDSSNGHVTVTGLLRNVNTSTYAINQTIYVASGGGFTNVRPTSSSVLVQNMGKVVNVGSNGEILVFGPGRTNDVPNAIISYNGIIFEGATVDDFETTLTAADPTADRTITLPNSDGTVALTANKLNAFASTSSSELAGVISDDTGTGSLVFANTPTLVSPILGTPQSGTLSNCTGLPVSTGIDGLASGMATFLATPSSANFGTTITDKIGSGRVVFSTSPTLTTPILGVATATTVNKVAITAPATGSTLTIADGKTLTASNTLTFTGTDAASVAFGGGGTVLYNGGALGTPSSGTLTNCTGLPVSTGISGLGTSVGAFLATPSSANLAAALTDETGSGSLVFATSPSLTTPSLGVATATSINKLSITAPATGSTLTIADGKTLTASNTLTFTGTDSSSVAFGGGGTVIYSGGALGTPSSGTLTNCTGLPVSTGVSGLGTGVATFLGTPSSANLAAAVSDETGSGSLVFATSPSLTTPSLGVATATSVNKVSITAPATGSTLTIADGKTLTASNTLTFTGTDSSSVAFGGGGTVLYNGGALGTPSSGTLTNCTGLPVSTGVSGLGSGVATFLATPSSANLAAAVTDETGSGALVFATSPSLTTPSLGAATATSVTGSSADITLSAAAGNNSVVLVPTGTGSVNVSSKKITNLATPTSTGDAATKAYVDSVAAGLNYHPNVHVATTANLSATYNNGTSGVGAFLEGSANGALGSIDNDPMAVNDRILVKNQTTQTQNGIYYVDNLGSVSTKWKLIRATDADNSIPGQVAGGDTVFVELGDSFGGTSFVLTGTSGTAKVLGTDSLVYTQYAGVSTTTAGAGLVKNLNALDVNVDNSTIEISTDTVRVKDAGITNTKLQNSSLTVNGTSISLGGSGTVTANTTNALTIGTGLSGTSFNGSSPVTIAIDSTVATLTGVQNLTNKTLTSPTLTTPALGTPSSGTLTNCTGYAVGNLSGLGSGVGTFLATPSSANLAAAVSDETGSGALVFATSPSLTTPSIGAATATSVNKVAITAPLTGSTLTIADGKTLTASNTLTFTGTDSSSVAFGGGGTVIYSGGALGTPSSGTLTNCTGLPVSTGVSGLGTGVATFLATPSSANLASAVSDETGSGALVFGTSPTLTTPTLGVATATSINKVSITAPATGSTLTIADGKTLTASNTLTFTGTDSSSVAFGGGGTVLYNGGALGTPSSGTLTNCTGLPVSTGVSGLGSGVATFLATPSSANLASAVSDETGSGALVFGTSPSLTTPSLSGETFSTSASVTAGTNAQGQGALTSDLNIITTASSNPSGVTLPTATTGRRLVVVNKGANPINVYPASGGSIDALSTNLSVQIPANGLMFFNASSTTQWYSSGNSTFTAPALGTPVSGTLTNCTGLPVSTGVSGLGSGVSTFLATPSSANLASAVSDETGTGALVFANTPTLVTPILGTPQSGTLTNCTNLPVSTGISGLGANVSTFLATASSANLAAAVTDETGSGALVFATSPTLVTPLLGTPTSGNLANCTGYTVGNLSGLGSGVGTFLATPSSANLAAAVTDETGSGALVFATSPSLTTPTLGVATATSINKVSITAPATGSTLTIADGKTLTASNTLTFTGTDSSSVAFGGGGTVLYNGGALGTPSSGTLTNCTGLPVSTGISGLGTGVAAFLATPSSANLASAVTDETGSGSLVFGTSPSITTSLTTGSASFDLVDTTATTVNFAGAATTLTVGHDGTSTSTTNIVTGATLSGNNKTINLGTGGASGSTTNVNIGSGSGGTVTVNSGLTVSGNLTVNGTTTTVNSTTITVDDPIITLGGDAAPTSDDNKDRGVEFRWHNGSVAKLGFFGYDDSLGRFVFIPDATNTGEVFSGTLGSIDVGDIFISGTASTGSGGVVRATSPTLVTPVLGTPSSGTLTNCTGYTVGNLSGLGSGVGTFLATPSSANLAAALTDETGSGALVFATSPTLVTPLLGTPTSGTLTNCTGYTVGNLSGLGTNVGTFLATPSSANLAAAVTDETGSGALVFATSPSLTTPSLGVATATSVNKVAITAPATGSTLTIADGKTLTASNTLTFTGTDSSSVAFGGGGTVIYSGGALGTPSSGTLTNCTGLPVSTGISGLGTGVATFLATPSSANLISAITDETGSGALVFATSPTLVTPVLGTPSSGTLTNCTGYSASNLSGLGSGVGTFLATPSSANLAAAVTDETGSGALVFATSPSLTTPSLGVATATSINKVTITAPVTSSTLTVADGKTLTVSNTLTFTGTDASSVAFGGGGTVLYSGGALGTPSSGTLTNCTGLPVSTGISGLGSGVATFLATPSSANLASAVTDETGSGSLVFGTSPSITTSLTTGSASFDLVDTTATTVNFAGAATSLTIGHDAHLSSTTNIATGATLSGNIKVVNLGTGGASGSTTNVNIGSGSGGTVTVNSGLTVTGDLTVNGTTTTVNSTTVTVDDPIITLGGDSAPTVDDNKDRGVEFRWHNGSAAKLGFFGYDDSLGRFVFIPDATNTSEVFSGTLGNIDVGDIFISGTASTGSGGVVRATSPTLTTPVLGTPSSGTLTNCTGYTLGNLSGLGSGVGTFLATPSSANLAAAVTDETGSGALVFGTSPSITTSLGTGSASFDLVNANATTVNFAGASTALTMGAAAGTTATIRGGTLQGNTSTQNLFNSVCTTLNIGGSATTLSIGGGLGTLTINNPSTVVAGDLAVNGGDITTSATTATVFDTTATTVTAFRSATTLTFAATTGTTQIRNDTTVGGDLTITGGDLITSAATSTLMNTTATNLSVGGAATTLTLGATSGTASVRNATTRLGTTAATIETNSGTTNALILSPYGNLNIVPTSSSSVGGSRPALSVENTDGGTGFVSITGGNLYLGVKTDGLDVESPVQIVFEGTTDANELTLTVASLTGDRTVTLPDATGTVALAGTGSTTDGRIPYYDTTTNTFLGSSVMSFNDSTSVVTLDGTVNIGGTLGTSNSTVNLLNATATTINFGGAATTLNLGPTGGTGTIDVNRNTIQEATLKFYNEPTSSPSISAGTLTLDLSAAQVFTVSLNASVTTLTISNTPATASRSIGFTLILTADGTARTVAWGAAVLWPGGTGPTLTSTNGKKDVFSFVTTDGGTTWLGFVGGQNY